MHADVRRWGNSLAIRIPAEVAEDLGLHEGDQVKAQLLKVPKGTIDVSHAPFFRDPDPRASEHHDRYIGEAIEEDFRRKQRRSK